MSEQLWAGQPGQDGWRQYLIADVFTATPLEGNQLGVFLDARELPAEIMQRTARELNLAETVFFLPPQAGGDGRVRIFTPAAELPFAGHPTLGSAFVLAERLGKDRITVETGVGPIPVEFDASGFGEMRQQFTQPEPYERADDLLAALHAGESELPVEGYQNGPRHVYVALPSEEAVASLKPDLGRLADHPVGVSCFAGGGMSWKTRMFAPSLGVPEDPATGSAAGPLAVHLARHGRTGYGARIEIRQGVEIGRPSLLHARAEHDPGTEQCVAYVGGHAVIVARGDYRLA